MGRYSGVAIKRGSTVHDLSCANSSHSRSLQVSVLHSHFETITLILCNDYSYYNYIVCMFKNAHPTHSHTHKSSPTHKHTHKHCHTSHPLTHTHKHTSFYFILFYFLYIFFNNTHVNTCKEHVKVPPTHTHILHTPQTRLPWKSWPRKLRKHPKSFKST